jgi:hypothetical protein
VPILADLFGIFNVFIHLFPKQPGKNWVKNGPTWLFKKSVKICIKSI